MKKLYVDPLRRALTRRARRRSSNPVVGGPFDGQCVRELVTTEDGAWILDRNYLCRPPDARRSPQTYYPYVLRDGVYVWNERKETQ